MKSIFSLLVLIALVGLYLTHSDDSARLAKVQSGELTLECHLRGGPKAVDPAKVVDFTEGRWFFTNGSATRCSTY